MWIPRPSEVTAATARIDPVFLGTPLLRSAALDRQFKAELLFKDETGTPIGSFKGRGACNLLAQMPPAAGVVCASAGNFGQGLAWAARKYAMPLTVFASQTAVGSKVAAMRSLGATVVQVGHDYDAAKSAAAEYSASDGLLYVDMLMTRERMLEIARLRQGNQQAQQITQEQRERPALVAG